MPTEEAEKTEAPAAEEAETEEPAFDAPEAEGDKPAEGESAAKDGEGAEDAEGEAKPADKPPEIPEDVLKAAAVKFANKTMAAARRAQAATEAVKTENTGLKNELGVHKEFVARLRGSDPMGALAQAGFPTLKAFHEHLIATGQAGEEKQPTVEDEVKKLRDERQADKDAAAKREQERVVEESRSKVFAAVDEQKAKYPRTATGIGKRELWAAIEVYHAKHGTCPDAAVWRLADDVERALRSDFGDPTSASPAAQQGNPAAATAATAARTGGKTLTNQTTSGAPARREYSLDPEERRRQVTEDMRAAGEL